MFRALTRLHPELRAQSRAMLLPLAFAFVAMESSATPYYFTTLAGTVGIPGSRDGAAPDVRFGSNGDNVALIGVAVSGEGNIYIADRWNNTIRVANPTGTTTTLAGTAGQIQFNRDDTGEEARFFYPAGIAIDNVGNLYVADSRNGTVRKVAKDGMVTTIAGIAGSYGNVDGSVSVAQFGDPEGVALDQFGNVYVADSAFHSIRKISPRVRFPLWQEEQDLTVGMGLLMALALRRNSIALVAWPSIRVEIFTSLTPVIARSAKLHLLVP